MTDLRKGVKFSRRTDVFLLTGISMLVSMMIISILFYANHEIQQQNMINKELNRIDELEIQIEDAQDSISDLQRKLEIQQEEQQKSARLEPVSRGISYREAEFKITYYTHTGSSTASGVMPTPNKTVACNYLPLGTHVLINGKEYTVEDRVGLSGNIIDIFVDSEEEAIQGGIKTELVKIMEG